MKKIRVRDIGLEGLTVEDVIQADVTGPVEEGDINFVEPLQVKISFEFAGKEIISRSEVKAGYSTFCYRCLESIKVPFNKIFVISFKADKTVEFLNIEEELRQEILLSLPFRNLCAADCKGLCNVCGANLNESECKCAKDN